MNVLIRFSINSWRPLVFGAASPLSSMYFSSEAKLALPASISAPMP
jgi:hypothetical protein